MSYYITNDANQYTSLLELYSNFIHDDILSSFAKTNWYSQNCNTYYFEFDSIPKIVFPSLDLIGSNGNDSIIIYNTKGVFYPSRLEFIGKNGKVDWSRAGLDPKEVMQNPLFFHRFKNSFLKSKILYYNSKYFHHHYPEKRRIKAINTSVTMKRLLILDLLNNKYIILKNLYENIDYVGGIYVKGNSFLGQGDDKNLAELLFKRDGNVVIRTKAKSFLLKEHIIESTLCNTSIYIKNDSIYHSAIHLRYYVDRKELWLIRGEDVSQVCLF